MPKITYITFTGEEFSVDAKPYSSVMENAVRNNIPGIVAECGGSCACGTCHVYVEEKWLPIVGAPDVMEETMLDTAFDVRPNSRLSCQIRVTEDMDGLVVHTPERQV